MSIPVSDSADNSSHATTSSTRNQSVVRYGLLLVVLGAIRVFELATSGTHLRVMAFESSAAWVATSIVAAIVCFLAACQLRKYYPPTITILMSIVIGAAITLIASSFPGMIVGLVAGLTGTFQIMRSFAVILAKAFGWVGLPAAIIGGLAGFLGATTGLSRAAATSETRVAICILTCLAVVSAAWIYLVGSKSRRKNGVKPLSDLLAFTAFFVTTIVAFAFAVEFDNQRRVRRTGTWLGSRVPLGFQTLVRGFHEPTYLMFTRTIDPADVEGLRPFRGITNLHGTVFDYSGGQSVKCVLNYEALEPLDLGGLINVQAYGNYPSGWTDEGLEVLANSTQINHLIVPLSEISDEGLSVLGNMPLLSELNLSASQVRGDGLRYLHEKAALLSLDLAGSPTDDRVFEFVSSGSLTHLDLAGTKVTGAGLASAKLPSLVTLNVANSKFDEANIEFTPASVRDINLSGNPISSIGTKQLAKRQSIRKLDLINTGVDDKAVLELSNCKIHQLTVDATQLTPAACAALSGVLKLEFVFEAGDRELDQIASQYEAIRAAIYQAQRRRFEGGISSMGGEVKFTIANLTVTKEMVPRLRELDIELSNPTVISSVGNEPMSVFHRDVTKYLVEIGAVRAKPVDVHDVEALYETEERRQKNLTTSRQSD